MDPKTKEAYEKKRRSVEVFFTNRHLIANSRQTAISPSGEYALEIDRYTTKGKSWDYSRGLVRAIKYDVLISDVKRNFGHFPYCWVEHPNGNEYLICGEDYQGYMVINLTKGIAQTYFPPEGVQGSGFCWVVHYPSPDKLVLAVEGCIWAYPYEVRFYNFSDPDVLPLAELGRVENTEKVTGWETNDTFVVATEYETVKWQRSDATRFSTQ